jgi:hypothetical protein
MALALEPSREEFPLGSLPGAVWPLESYEKAALVFAPSKQVAHLRGDAPTRLRAGPVDQGISRLNFRVRVL